MQMSRRRRQAFPMEALLIERTVAEPIQRQLYRQIAAMIRDKRLAPGSELPSTRALADDLGLARNTIVGAYDQLTTEGYLTSRPGARAIVVDLPANSPGSDRRSASASATAIRHPLSMRGESMMRQPFHHGAPGRFAFHPGMPDAQNFPFGVWGRLLARRATFGADMLFGTYHVTGLPALKEAIASYLVSARGVRCLPEQIVVTTGAQAAFDLLARLLLDPGDTVWLEEPGYYAARATFTVAGGNILPLTVDGDGWQMNPPEIAPRLIYVTPACQHPLGTTMRMDQRLRLFEIAERHNSWIVEDDFDGEYRFQGRPVPAIQSMDYAERVIYVGTFAKLLFPALRLGFMVLPPALCEGIPHALSTTGQFAPLVLQAALADFIDEGHMSRHLKRMRRIYAERRKLFQDLFAAELPANVTLSPAEAGIQLVAHLPADCDDRAVVEAADRLGVNASPLSKYYWSTSGNGLVLGYAACNKVQTEAGMRRLRQAIEQSRILY
ncbi:PLP-dependent aminotransferase family protein [Mesorhizobium sp. B2-4-15]|uniref:rhizopine catabolism transcriptional regulator MocR n=1 Tax=Mesorhizobium sp. B2-4-15 TaxID=2589934 RepID=UPI00115425B3|nr:PLP-dependent aminotransferase family protein [Mesorhizobium sp. B2-4-15]TPK61163.1 PLP-dependent aminotransferase family protein [Mesorhizobium sp. B2-4-15]